MFKKSKQKKEQQARQASEARIQIEKAFDAEIQKAGAIKDPAEKILALHRIEERIQDQIENTRQAIIQEATKKGDRVDGAVTLATVAGSTGAIAYIGIVGVAAAGPIGWIAAPVLFMGSVAGSIVRSKRYSSTKKNLELATADHMENLKGQADLVAESMKETVAAGVKEVSASPLYKNVREIPGIKNIFADAAAQQIVDDQQELIALKEVAQAAAKKQTRTQLRYDDLKGL